VTKAYSKRSSSGLCGLRLQALGAVAALTFALGGCSSYQLGDMFASGSSSESTAAAYAPVQSSRQVESSTEADLAIAKAAAEALLARGSGDSSQPWENPRTGARGTVTPIASPYVENGVTCRTVLVSHVRGSIEGWYQGGACRKGAEWQLRELKPLRRSS
jgi:surface antigen